MTEPLKDAHEREVAVAVQSSGSETRFCMTCHHTFGSDISHCPEDAAPLVDFENDPLIGTLIGKNRILSVIGQGGMGVVYKAEQILMQRIVALKMIRSGAKDSGAILRFQQEAKAVSALDHPNIVKVYECGISDEGSPYLVMEFIEGKTLADDGVKFGIGQSVDVFIQLCDALAHAHEKGVIHRDLKPGNIAFTNGSINGSPPVKILDFGIAKMLPSSGKQFVELTRTGQPIGSPSYMSPEQCKAEELDARSDIYSLGCVMYKVLTGKPVFEGDLFIVLSQHLKEVPAPFSKVCPDVSIPVELEEVVFRCLEKNRDHRYQSMTELQEALKAFRTTSGRESTIQFLSSRIRRAVRYRRKAYAYLLAWFTLAVFVVAGAFKPVFQQYVSDLNERHSQEIASKVKQAGDLNDQALAKRKDGNCTAAEELLRKATLIEESLPDRSDCNVMRSKTLDYLGLVYLQTESYSEAESKFESCLKLMDVIHTANKLPLVGVMLDLAEACRFQEKMTKASETVRKAKDIADHFAGKNSDDFAKCLMYEGLIAEVEKQLDGAYNKYSAAVQIRQKLFGETDLRCSIGYKCLSRVCMLLGKTKEAAEWAQKLQQCK